MWIFPTLERLPQHSSLKGTWRTTFALRAEGQLPCIAGFRMMDADSLTQKKQNVGAESLGFLLVQVQTMFFFEDCATGAKFFLALTHFHSFTLWVVSIIVLSNQLASTPVLVSGTSCWNSGSMPKKRWLQTHVEVWHVSYNQVPEPIYQVP